MDAPGAERYGRVAKTIVQARGAAANAPQAAAPLGLPLEIVLERGQFRGPAGAALPVRVFYRGHALAGATVDLVNLDHDAAPAETRLTGEGGRASFTAPRAGRWLLSVVWTAPARAGDDVDFETWFSSLTFGFGGGEARRAGVLAPGEAFDAASFLGALSREHVAVELPVDIA